jgi:YidC/Oxa1 family membrane protein insertase
MNRLKPDLDKLKKKYEKEPKKLMEEQMKLYRHHKVSMVPLSGCLPIFLQIPVFFGLFAALRASVDLRQASWLWVKDLSQPDHLVRFETAMANPMSFCSGCCGSGEAAAITGLHILPILMTIAWVANSYFMPRPANSTPEQDQMRKMMMFMPAAFGLFMYTYAAGLSLYWLTSSLIGIVESRLIKKLWPIVLPPVQPMPPKPPTKSKQS